MAFNAGALVSKLVLDTKGFSAGIKQATKQTGGLEKKALSLSNVLGKALAAGALTAVVVAFKKATDAAGKFEKSMANVSTLVDTAVVDINALSNAVLDMTTEVLKSSEDLSSGLYQVFSAGITDSAEAMDVLRVAAIAATAGLADTRSSVDAITTILNAYGLEADKATKISDLMFQTVKLGKTTFTELASAIGTVIAPAASLGIKLEDLFSALATLTKGGFDTRTATTALRATFLSILKPADEATKTAKKLGLEWTASALKAKGLVKFLNELKEAAGGNTEIMAKLIPETRALNAVLALTGEQSGELNKILGEMGDSLGSTQEAFKKQEDTYESQSVKLGLLVDRMQIKIGNFFLPALTSMLKGLLNFFDIVGIEIDTLTAKLDPLGKEVQQLGKLVKDLNGETRRVFTQEDINRVSNVTQALKDLGVSTGELGKKTREELGEIVNTVTSKLVPQIDGFIGMIMPGLVKQANESKALITKIVNDLATISNTKITNTFNDLKEEGEASAAEVEKAWKAVPDAVKEAFENLGIIPKKQFDQLAQDLIDDFKTITQQERLTDQELLALREQLFVRLGELADEAKAAGVLGFDPDEVKAELEALHQQLLANVITFQPEIEAVGNATVVTAKKIQQSQFEIARDTVESLRSVIDNAFLFQVDTFSSLKDQLESYQEKYIAVEEEITKVIVVETEKRATIIQRFVDGALQQFNLLPVAGFGGAQSGVGGELSGSTESTINQSVTINNPGSDSVEQGHNTIGAFNSLNAELSF